MKRFEIITEADARTLSRGEVVELASGGHVTPLARDTLRAQQVTVVHQGRTTEEEAGLAPVAEIRSVAIGSDHTGVTLRRTLISFLRSRGLSVHDLGTDRTEAVDYPDIAAEVARTVARHEADAGIVIDGAGLGSAIAANKIAGIRAAMANSELLARYAREHNGTNVLAIGASLVGADEAKAIVSVWLSTPMREPRYIRRLAKIRDLENSWKPEGR